MKNSNYLLTLLFLLCCLPTLLVGQHTLEVPSRKTCIPNPNQKNCTIKINVNGLKGSCADTDCDCNCDGRIILDRRERDISEVVQVRVGGVDPCADEEALCRMIEKWQLGQLPHDPITRHNPYSRASKQGKIHTIDKKFNKSHPKLERVTPNKKQQLVKDKQTNIRTRKKVNRPR